MMLVSFEVIAVVSRAFRERSALFLNHVTHRMCLLSLVLIIGFLIIGITAYHDLGDGEANI